MGSALPADTVASDTPTQVYRKHFPQSSLTGLTDPGWMIAYLTMRSFDLNHQTLKELLPINVRALSGLPRRERSGQSRFFSGAVSIGAFEVSRCREGRGDPPMGFQSAQKI
jgi:hypothetical protein